MQTTPPSPSTPGAESTADATYLQWKHWESGAFAAYDDADAAYFAAEVPIHRQARVLEIGFGNGAFLAWARKASADILGIEANPYLVMRAKELLGDSHVFATVFAPELDVHRGFFTHIVAFDVLEHISQTEYPKLFLRFAELLAPGGRCTLRFPSGDSPFGRAVQHGDPTHVTTIGTAMLAYFAIGARLKVAAVRAPALPTKNIGLRRALRRRFALALRFVIESLIGYAYFGRRVSLDQNTLVVLVRDP
jgi:hypothetical protein